MAKDKLLLEKIKKQINKAKVVSFDIFDTLLVRPYVRPIDLFEHMEKAYDCPGFAAERKDAERRTRIRHKELEDVTFDMIYDEIDDEFKDMKQKEMDWEEMVLRANPELKQVYDYALEQGKIVVITSDMYLPTEFLAKVLRKNGFDNWDKLYVSGDVGKSKVKGTLFEHLLEDNNVSPKDVLHIGDNEKSDVNVPKKLKFNVYYWQKICIRLFEDNPRAKIFFDKHKNDLGASILLATIAWAYFDDMYNYWHDFGFKYAGPVIFAFMKWLDNELNKDQISEVMFVARDGYTLQKVFDIIKTRTVITHYYYCPRSLNLSSSEECDALRSYINTFHLQNEKIALVDSISARLSAQRALMVGTRNKEIKGYYWYAYPLNRENVSMFQQKSTREFVDWNMMEWFMTAPTPPALRIENNTVIFNEIHPNEQKRIEAYPDLSQGAVDYAKIISDIFANIDIQFSAALMTDWVNCLCTIPTDLDKNWFSQILHAWNPEHTKWEPLPTPWYTPKKNNISNNETYKMKFYLFGFIPLISFVVREKTKKVFFGGLLLWRIKIRNLIKKYYLLGFILLFKSKKEN